MEEDLKILEEMLEKEKECLYYDIDQNEVQAIENIINRYKELEQENKVYEITLDIFNEREYRKRYLEERRAEEPNLLYPDADEIYKRYYELREENRKLNNMYIKEYNEHIEMKRQNEVLRNNERILKENSIPKSKIEEKIKELGNMLEETMKGNLQLYTVGEIIYFKGFLQELLESEKNK